MKCVVYIKLFFYGIPVYVLVNKTLPLINVESQQEIASPPTDSGTLELNVFFNAFSHWCASNSII